MKILILGAKGNLGGQLVKIFEKDEKYEVIPWDKEDIDITDKELVFKKIEDIKPVIIINTAAYNAVDKCEESQQEYEKTKKLNGLAPGYLAEAAVENKSLLVHYSSDYVFGGNSLNDGLKNENILRYEEDDEPCPVNKYGETKLLGEREIISRSGQGLKWYLIRSSKLFGPKGESEIAKPSFFDLMLKLAQEKDILDVVDEELSGFAYTPDLAEATKNLIESDEGYGIYHLLNEGEATWYQAAKELFKQKDIPVKINPVSSDSLPRAAKRPKYSVLLNTKFKKLRFWQEALREYL